MKIQLLDKPSIMQLPLPPRSIKLNLKPPQKTRNKFIYLQQTNILADTSSTPGAELKHCGFHFLALTCGTVEPAFGDEGVDGVGGGIVGGTECWLVAVDYPGVAADYYAAGDVVGAYCDAGGWGDSLEWEAGGGMETEGFFNYRVEVGEGLRFSPGD